MYAPPLLSRILLVVSAVIVLGVSFVFVSRALEPVPAQIPPMPRQAESFNPKADVASNPSFSGLSDIFITGVPDLPLGRSNPFLDYYADQQQEVLEPQSTTTGQKLPIEDISTTTTETMEIEPVSIEVVSSSESILYE